MQPVQQALPETMRAWRATRFGGLDALNCESTSVPLLYGDEVLVEVQAAALNPVDLKTLHGLYPAVAQHDLPFTLGRDVAGVIAQGTRRAAGWEPGTRVCAFVGQGPGALADYVSVSASALANAPRAGAVDTAAAIPLAALTAWQGLFDYGKLERGQRVLIHGASGGVGRFAVQFARHCGAHVIVTASAPTHDALRALGASEAIDYRHDGFEDLAGEVDLVLDLVGGAVQARSWGVLKHGGAMVSALDEPSQIEADSHGAFAARYTARPDGAQLEHIVALFDQGAIKVEVAERFNFGDVGGAFERMEKGHLHGKLVVMREWHQVV
ncbi:NADP-dependent oxidoreductase [Paraburkholderia tagetis]|uniref:NADP-dependent oxidoreductase n=1 Tax=Paraburkholderia tagetis TaxID=2913261 RepID=A0A9X1UGE5_9BURK|nr:NADP-dependent oxidoreductase [Paraburkholderia tagetis]MCG5075370.1 NADP-dependent oxidoreductase [Paraburkholderia tagetis]